MLRAVFPSASGHETTPQVAIVVKPDQRDRLANDERVSGQLDAVLERVAAGGLESRVTTLAADMGLSITEKRITRDEVYIADEAFFTGTAAEVTPIRELDNRPIGEGRRGPITERLQTAYFDLVHGRNKKHLDLLTFI